MRSSGCSFEFINRPDVLEGVKQRHQYFVDALNKINAQYGLFKEIRGQGLLIGCVLKDEHAGKAKNIVTLAGEEGLLALVAGRCRALYSFTDYSNGRY